MFKYSVFVLTLVVALGGCSFGTRFTAEQEDLFTTCPVSLESSKQNLRKAGYVIAEENKDVLKSDWKRDPDHFWDSRGGIFRRYVITRSGESQIRFREEQNNTPAESHRMGVNDFYSDNSEDIQRARNVRKRVCGSETIPFKAIAE